MANGITFERDGAVARIILDRPDVGNALDMPMARELKETAIRCDGDAGIRCVVMTGRGRLFCTGGDVGALAGAGDKLPEFLEEITTYAHAAISVLARMNKPLVTALNGPAAGAGIGFAILGDIVLADPTAHLSLAYTAVGMSPDGGTTWLLPRLIGLRRAQELFLTNRRIGAEEAAAMGLVTRVVEEGSLQSETEATAGKLATSATTALGATRRLLLESFSNSLENQMDMESRVMAGQARTRDGQEGVAAFAGKRSAHFVGDA